MFTWIGSIVSLLGTMLTSKVNLGLLETWLVVFFSVVYLLGVHGKTIAIQIPLDNHIQKVVIEQLNDGAITY